PPRVPRPGEPLFSFVRGHDRFALRVALSRGVGRRGAVFQERGVPHRPPIRPARTGRALGRGRAKSDREGRRVRPFSPWWIALLTLVIVTALEVLAVFRPFPWIFWTHKQAMDSTIEPRGRAPANTTSTPRQDPCCRNCPPCQPGGRLEILPTR